MHGGQRERCASSAAAFSAGREPSTYSPRSSTQSEQCSKRLIIDVPLVSGSMPRKCGRFGGCHDRSLSKEIAKLLPERKPCAVETAFHRRNRQIERRGDLLVREPVDVLEQEHGPIILRQGRDRLVDRLPQFP